MPSYFFDSSALVKRYHFEPGSVWVRAVCEGRARPSLYISQLTEVEVIAALRRLGRLAQLHPSFVDSLVNTFTRHITYSRQARRLPMYRILPVSASVITASGALCNTHWQSDPFPLRSLDAIHLASALIVATSITDELVFVTSDERLAAVAQRERLQTLNPAFPSS